MEQGNASQPSQETPHHTPGPWLWKRAPWGSHWLVPAELDPDSVGPDYRPILDADPSGGEYFLALDPESPDGKLIEQASELLAVLKALMEPDLSTTEAERNKRDEYNSYWWARAWAVLAAVEGRDAE